MNRQFQADKLQHIDDFTKRECWFSAFEFREKPHSHTRHPSRIFQSESRLFAALPNKHVQSSFSVGTL